MGSACHQGARSITGQPPGCSAGCLGGSYQCKAQQVALGAQQRRMLYLMVVQPLILIHMIYLFPNPTGGLGLPTAASLAGVPLFSTAPSAASSSLPMPGSIPPTFLSSLSSLLSTPIASPSTSSKLKPLVYSPALPPVPAKALEKIRANLYFDLKELLPDNAALLQRLQELSHLTALGSQPQSAVRLREINNPLTWIFCYLSFVAAKTESEETRDLIAYGQIILQLARRHGGPGWLTYDQQFRQQAAGGSLTPWREINNSLLSATVLAAQSETGTSPRRLFCTQCQGDGRPCLY